VLGTRTHPVLSLHGRLLLLAFYKKLPSTLWGYWAFHPICDSSGMSFLEYLKNPTLGPPGKCKGQNLPGSHLRPPMATGPGAQELQVPGTPRILEERWGRITPWWPPGDTSQSWLSLASSREGRRRTDGFACGQDPLSPHFSKKKKKNHPTKQPSKQTNKNKQHTCRGNIPPPQAPEVLPPRSRVPDLNLRQQPRNLGTARKVPPRDKRPRAPSADKWVLELQRSLDAPGRCQLPPATVHIGPGARIGSLDS
jgi:hypothetical protein